jgi:hypothetical protein
LADGDAAKQLLQRDLLRYEAYLNDTEAFLKDTKEDIQLRVAMLQKLDRYPEVPVARLNDYAEALESKMKKAFAVLEQQPKQNMSVDPEYWATSKFRVLSIHQGTIVCMPDGDVPPGAVELLSGQIIDTKVDGEEVHIEVENVEEGKMLLWFKPDVTVPAAAELVWSYAFNPVAPTSSGTKWLTQDSVVAVSSPGEHLIPSEGTETGEWAVEHIQPEPEFEPPKFYPPAKIADPFKPVAEKLKKVTAPETADLFNQALLRYGEHFDLPAEYASHYDREVIDAKRDRYLATLNRARVATIPVINPVNLAISYAVKKGELIDALRVVETQVAGYTLKARLHERKLAGEPITMEEELEYQPHLRDEFELDRDYCDPSTGRYIWQLHPQMEGDPDCLLKDIRYKDLPPRVNSLAKMLVDYEKAVPSHVKAERALLNDIIAVLSLKQKEEDNKNGKMWPGQE